MPPQRGKPRAKCPLEGLDAPQPKNTPVHPGREAEEKSLDIPPALVDKGERGGRGNINPGSQKQAKIIPGVIWHVCPEGMYLPAAVAHGGVGTEKSLGTQGNGGLRAGSTRKEGCIRRHGVKSRGGEPKD